MFVATDVQILEAELDRLLYFEDAARVSLRICKSSEVSIMRRQLRAAEAAVRECKQELAAALRGTLA